MVQLKSVIFPRKCTFTKSGLKLLLLFSLLVFVQVGRNTLFFFVVLLLYRNRIGKVVTDKRLPSQRSSKIDHLYLFIPQLLLLTTYIQRENSFASTNRPVINLRKAPSTGRRCSGDYRRRCRRPHDFNIMVDLHRILNAL